MRILPVYIFILFVICSFGATAQPSSPDFNTFKAELSSRMREQGISEQVILQAITPLEGPVTRVIELDRSQPEYVQTLNEYLTARVTPARLEKGREMLKKHRVLLNKIGAEYGVDPRYIVALWGMETNYGSFTGSFPIIPSLVTLVYDGRRGAYFESELLNALKILEEEPHIKLADFKGSWAGAMGQCQFMPSNFRKYAVDYNQDGRKDIWGTEADVFASAANYLKNFGWDDTKTWGRRVLLPAGFDVSQTGHKDRNYKPLSQWQALGVRRMGGRDLPNVNVEGRILIPENAGGQAFLVYSNFDTILRWNKADFFAIAVGTLADKLKQG